MTDTFDSKWLRPKVLRPPEPEKDPVIFQQMDIDHYGDLKREGFLGPDESRVPITRIFGVTRDGHSILCHVHGFHPYFYVYTSKKPDESRLEQFRQMLDHQAKSRGKLRADPLPQWVMRVEYVQAKSIYGYHGDDKHHFLKIVVAIPQAMQLVQTIFQSKDLDPMGVYFADVSDVSNHKIYEANIDYDVRFMCDLNVHGCGWIELPPNKYKLREPAKSHCQLECDINYTDIISHQPEGDWAGFASFRTLSFDIECTMRGTMFPQPEHDAVIQISNLVVTHGIEEPLIKCIFTLHSCAPIAGATVLSFETEGEMLMAWSKFVVQIDPDIITGYNIQQFDLRYLLKRAKKLKLNKFPCLGRMINYMTTPPPVSKQSKLESAYMTISGRVQFDLIKVLRRDYKLRSYKLNDVSDYFLQERKEDVHYSEIPKLFKGDEHTRRKLAIYCLQDSLLVIKILKKLVCLVNYMQMARVTGVPLRILVAGEQQVKVLSQILREARKHNYVVPTLPAQVAKVSKIDYYNLPIASIDFASHYPSLIIDNNLCYTTLLDTNAIDKYQLRHDEYTKTPAGYHFRKPSEGHETILPRLFNNMLASGKRIADQLELEDDPYRRTLLNCQNWAFSVNANSLWRFLSDPMSKLPCWEIFNSATSLEQVLLKNNNNKVKDFHQ